MKSFWQGINSDTLIAALALVVSLSELLTRLWSEYFANAKINLYLQNTTSIKFWDKTAVPFIVYLEIVNKSKLPLTINKIIGINKKTKEQEIITPVGTQGFIRKKLDYTESSIIVLFCSVFEEYSKVLIEDTLRHKFWVPTREIKKIKQEIQEIKENKNIKI